MSELNSFRDVQEWFLLKSRLSFNQGNISEDLRVHLTKSCILVPGPNESQIWYQPDDNGFYHVDYTMRNKSLVCAYETIFGGSNSVSKGRKSRGECFTKGRKTGIEMQVECKATLSLNETSKHFKHSHPAFCMKQAFQLCYSWAVELLSCAVCDPSWLAVGVGYLSSFWPKELLLLNTREQTSQVETALLMSQRRNAEGKKRFLCIFSAEKFLRFSTTILGSPVFNDALLDDRIRWESFSQIAYDLVKGALEWQLDPRAQLDESMMLRPSTYREDSDIDVEVLLSEKVSTPLRLDIPDVTDGGAFVVANSGPSETQPGKEMPTTSSPGHVPSEDFQSTPRSGGPPAKKRIMASLHEIEIDNSANRECSSPDLLVRKTGKRMRSRVRKTPAPRSFVSRSKSKKRRSRDQESRDMSPFPQGSLHGVPDVMAPIVILHRLPSCSLAKLKKQNGKIFVTDLVKRHNSNNN